MLGKIIPKAMLKSRLNEITELVRERVIEYKEDLKSALNYNLELQSR